jgi:hypothetical protein
MDLFDVVHFKKLLLGATVSCSRFMLSELKEFTHIGSPQCIDILDVT